MNSKRAYRYRPVFLDLLSKNPNVACKRVVELVALIGSAYGVDFHIHFPVRSKLFDTDSYGTENVSIVIDKLRKRFPISREEIKARILELLGSSVIIHDAHMYEEKEGLRVVLEQGRIEVLPGSMHFWGIIDDRAGRLGDWLMSNVYFVSASA